ncbi:MAG: hypothetical protein ABFD12_06695, partial [Syntrophorhabdus sp.]
MRAEVGCPARHFYAFDWADAACKLPPASAVRRYPRFREPAGNCLIIDSLAQNIFHLGEFFSSFKASQISELRAKEQNAKAKLAEARKVSDQNWEQAKRDL